MHLCRTSSPDYTITRAGNLSWLIKTSDAILSTKISVKTSAGASDGTISPLSKITWKTAGVEINDTAISVMSFLTCEFPNNYKNRKT